ncbi:MAG: TlpA disulfide reductase family protein, partial [bacterium]
MKLIHGFLLASLMLGLTALPVAAADAPVAEKVEYKEGTTFPTFEGTTWTGDAFNLADHLNKGKYVLVDFWAAWCPPCRAELPHMVKVMNETQNDRFEIVSISLDDEKSKEHLQQIVTDNGLSFPIVTDWLRWKSAYVTQYGVNGIPANFLLAPDGTVLMRDLRGELLEEVTDKFANTPDLDYKPITLTLTLENPPGKLSDEMPNYAAEPLTATLDITNPQAIGSELKAGITRTAYVRTGPVSLKKNADGTIVEDADGNPRIFQVAKTVTDEYAVGISALGPDGHTVPKIVVPMPDGTMDCEIIPFTWSPVLDMRIEGAGQYPSYSVDVWLDEDALDAQGGIIDPATYIPEATEATTAD